MKRTALSLALFVALLLGVAPAQAATTNAIPLLMLTTDANGNGLSFTNLHNLGVSNINGVPVGSLVTGVSSLNGLTGNVLVAYTVIPTNTYTPDTFVTNGQTLTITHYGVTNGGVPLFDTNTLVVNAGVLAVNTNLIATQPWVANLVVVSSNGVVALLGAYQPGSSVLSNLVAQTPQTLNAINFTNFPSLLTNWSNLTGVPVNIANWVFIGTNAVYNTNANLQAGSPVLSNLVTQTIQALNGAGFTNLNGSSVASGLVAPVRVLSAGSGGTSLAVVLDGAGNAVATNSLPAIDGSRLTGVAGSGGINPTNGTGTNTTVTNFNAVSLSGIPAISVVSNIVGTNTVLQLNTGNATNLSAASGHTNTVGGVVTESASSGGNIAWSGVATGNGSNITALNTTNLQGSLPAIPGTNLTGLQTSGSATSNSIAAVGASLGWPVAGAFQGPSAVLSNLVSQTSQALNAIGFTNFPSLLTNWNNLTGIPANIVNWSLLTTNLATMSGSNLLHLDATNIEGSLPAIPGTNVTGLQTGGSTTSNSIAAVGASLGWPAAGTFQTGSVVLSNLVSQTSQALNAIGFTNFPSLLTNWNNLTGIPGPVVSVSTNNGATLTNLPPTAVTTNGATGQGWYLAESNGVSVWSLNGGALTNLAAGQLAGTVADARLPLSTNSTVIVLPSSASNSLSSLAATTALLTNNPVGPTNVYEMTTNNAPGNNWVGLTNLGNGHMGYVTAPASGGGGASAITNASAATIPLSGTGTTNFNVTAWITNTSIGTTATNAVNCTLTGNSELFVTNLASPSADMQTIRFRLIQDATGNRLCVIPTNNSVLPYFDWGPDITVGATGVSGLGLLPLSTNAGYYDLMAATYNAHGTNWLLSGLLHGRTY